MTMDKLISQLGVFINKIYVHGHLHDLRIVLMKGYSFAIAFEYLVSLFFG